MSVKVGSIAWFDLKIILAKQKQSKHYKDVKFQAESVTETILTPTGGSYLKKSPFEERSSESKNIYKELWISLESPGFDSNKSKNSNRSLNRDSAV